MKEHTILYELCEVTHIANILSAVALNIEFELKKIGLYGGDEATIIFIDEPTELQDSNDDVKGVPKCGQIIVNIARIPLAKKEILDYIFRKFSLEEIAMGIDFDAGSITVSWKNALPVYADSRDKAENTNKSSDDSNNSTRDLVSDCANISIQNLAKDNEYENTINKVISTLPLKEISNFLSFHLKDEKQSKVNIAVIDNSLDQYSLYIPIKVDLYKYTVNVPCDVEYIGNWISEYFGSELSSYAFKLVATAYDDNSKPGYVIYEVALK